MQFSRPSGIAIDRKRTYLCGRFRIGIRFQNHDGWKRGIRVGRLQGRRRNRVHPDPVEKATTTSAAEGIAVDAMGNIFGAEVASKRIVKYVKN